MPRTEAQTRALVEYRKKCKRLQIDFFPTEQDLIDWLDKQDKKATYIKELIRKDMERK